MSILLPADSGMLFPCSGRPAPAPSLLESRRVAAVGTKGARCWGLAERGWADRRGLRGM